MIRLHARNYAKLREARDVGGGDVLRVLDPEASIARAVLALHALEDIELQIYRPIPNRVDDHVQMRLVGTGCPRVKILGRIHEQPAVRWRIGERLHHCRGVGAQRSVDEAFEPTDPEPGVSVSTRADNVAKATPR